MSSSGHQSSSSIEIGRRIGSVLVTEVGSVHGGTVKVVVVELELEPRLSRGTSRHRCISTSRLAVAHHGTRIIKVGKLGMLLG